MSTGHSDLGPRQRGGPEALPELSKLGLARQRLPGLDKSLLTAVVETPRSRWTSEDVVKGEARPSVGCTGDTGSPPTWFESRSGSVCESPEVGQVPHGHAVLADTAGLTPSSEPLLLDAR